METGDIKRFASAGDFASYCRTVDARHLSNSKKKADNNQKCGNRDPLDATSVLKLIGWERTGQHLAFTWTSVPGRAYRLCSKSTLNGGPWVDVSDDISAQGATTTWTAPCNLPSSFFAVRLVVP